MEQKIEERNSKVVKTYGFKRKTSDAQPRLLPVIPNGFDIVPKSAFSNISEISEGVGYERDISEYEEAENQIMYFEPLKSDKKSQISLSSPSQSQSSTEISSAESSPHQKFSHKRKRTNVPLQPIHNSLNIKK